MLYEKKIRSCQWALVILLAVLQPGMTVLADETTIENTTPVEKWGGIGGICGGRASRNNSGRGENPGTDRRGRTGKAGSGETGISRKARQIQIFCQGGRRDRQCMHIRP